MPLICDRAVCIRKVEYSETSQILALFTRRHGLIRVIAKGAHRTTKAGASKFDGGLDLLDEGDALFTDRVEKDLNTLAEWKLLDGHRGLRAAQRPLYLGLYLAEIVGALFEAHDPHPPVFDRLVATLDALATPACEEAALALVLDLLGESGYMPALDGCAECGRPTAGDRELCVSAGRGGVICRGCEAVVTDRQRVEPGLVGIANTILRLPRERGIAVRLPRLTRAQTDPLHAVLARHLIHNSGQHFRMVRHVLPTRAQRPASGAATGVPATRFVGSPAGP